MRNLTILIFALFLISCSDKDVVIQKYGNGQAKVKYKIIEGSKEKPVEFLFQAFYENGTLMKVGLIKNNAEEGEWKHYFEDGKISSIGQFDKGIRSGKFIRYYDTGQIEQEGNYLNGEISEIKFFFRNGTLKPKDYKVTTVIKPNCVPWTEQQKKKIKSRCNQVLQFDFSNSFLFCDCAVESTTKHVDFNVVDTLSDIERSSIYQAIIQNSPCAEQYW